MLKHLTFAIAALIAAPLAAQQADETPATLFRDVRVFDGEVVHEKRSVLVRDGRIASPDHRGPPPAYARIIEGSGRTLLPGFIDAHVHAYTGLEDALLFGVTTVIDQFTAPQTSEAARARTAAGDNPGEADILSAGNLATAPGGHGTQFGIAVPTLATPAEADAWVAARIAEGSDFIKIVREPGRPEAGRALPTLDGETIRALVEAAHRRGKLAVVHANALADARIAIEAGADGLVHLFADAPVDADFVNAASEAGVFISPTFAIAEVFAGRGGSAPLLRHPAFVGLLGGPAAVNLGQTIPANRTGEMAPVMAANITALQQAGVPILAGSDAPNPGTWLGISLHRELELLVEAGLTPTEALVAATSAPADAYRIKRHGRIAEGAAADLVLVEGDPTRDILATRAIVEVWKDGRSAAPLPAARRERIAAAEAGRGQPLALPAEGIIARFAAPAESVAPPAITAPFGSWTVSTDQMMGGSSTAGLALTGEGALAVTGNVQQGGFARWAGIAFAPGEAMMQPADLSNATALAFPARGSGAGFGVMGLSEASGQMPVTETFTIREQWREIRIPFAALEGFDPSAATMLLIGALEPGEYRLELADIRLVAD